MKGQNKELDDGVKIRVYITSFLTVSAMGAMLSMFSMVKDKLNRQLHLESSFLSCLDSLYFTGKILGSLIFLMFPSKQPKKTYFIACSIASMCQLLLPISIYLGDYGKYTMLIGMVGSGVAKAFILTPFLFLSQYFDKQSDKPKLSIWNATILMGDIGGVLFAYLTVYEFSLRWDLSYEFCVFFYFICALVFYFSVDQKAFCNLDQSCIQIGIKEKILKSYFIITNFYKQPKCYLWCIDFCLQAIFIASVVFWFPYYFVQNGFGMTSALITVAFYVANIIGTIVFENLVQKLNLNNDFICAGMLLIQALILLAGTILLQPSKQNSGFYIMMLTIIGFMSGGVVNRIYTTDFLSLVGTDKEVKYYAIFFSRLCQSLLAIIVMALIGHLMLINKKYLFFIMITIMLLSFFVYSFRKFYVQQNQYCDHDQNYDEFEIKYECQTHG